MLNTVIWAIGTFAITSTVWIAIVLLERKRRESALRDELHEAREHIALLEEKLDFAERQLLDARPEERLPLRP
jgi:hypothetical protein